MIITIDLDLIEICSLDILLNFLCVTDFKSMVVSNVALMCHENGPKYNFDMAQFGASQVIFTAGKLIWNQSFWVGREESDHCCYLFEEL